MMTIPLLLWSETVLPTIRWVFLVQNRASMTIDKRHGALPSIPGVIEGPPNEVGAKV